MRRSYAPLSLLPLVLLFLAVPFAHGASSQQAQAFLSNYIANYTGYAFTFTNSSIGPSTYIVAQSGTNSTVVVINATGANPSFVTNATLIVSIVRPVLTAKYAPTSGALANLTKYLTLYSQQTSTQFSDCLVETGLTTSTCTLSNQCQSCGQVPNCKKVLVATGGPSQSFGLGIANFSIQYNQLVAYFSEYFAVANTINSTNVGYTLPQMYGITVNITSISKNITSNPLFPLPGGFSPSQLLLLQDLHT